MQKYFEDGMANYLHYIADEIKRMLNKQKYARALDIQLPETKKILVNEISILNYHHSLVNIIDDLFIGKISEEEFLERVDRLNAKEKHQD